MGATAMTTISPDLLLGAIARGWCATVNMHKEVDPDLAISIALELDPIIEQYAAERVAETRKPLTDEQIENCIDAANRKFNSRRMGPCGQQMTTYDNWKYWLVHEIENAHGIGEQQNG
jgi:hypothetical protein